MVPPSSLFDIVLEVLSNVIRKSGQFDIEVISFLFTDGMIVENLD